MATHNPFFAEASRVADVHTSKSQQHACAVLRVKHIDWLTQILSEGRFVAEKKKNVNIRHVVYIQV